MRNKITLALIGRGHWGQVYKHNLQELNQKSPVGIPRIILPEANICGRDYKNILTESVLRGIDGAIIAVSTAAHYAVAEYLLTHGLRCLLIEKPLTNTFSKAKKLEKLLQEYPKAKIMVGHTLIYDPAYNIMKDIAESKIGQVKQLCYTSLKTPRIEGKTIIPDAGSPPIYLFMDAAGGLPSAVSVKPTHADNLELTLEFANGLRGIANIGTLYPERKREIMMVGNRGQLLLNEFMEPRELAFINKDGKKESLTFPRDYTALQAEILEFAGCILQEHKIPRTTLSAGMAVVKIIKAAEDSIKKGGAPIVI